ncbi:DUF3824 domain-containing protein [Varibaculum cambriense]|uniref:DUF3824 domain-containing protein n=1 Tax=Varibaculum cambriense TaxID=184870 RepID=UPI002552AA1A|nr:DUF3824 domain-containing protein [Varibaculum cambriense]MDK8275042.1 DUF3824 domain-containing protein [Varibaculum cambriense]MDU7408006.1 DUF3824 domain-containing protein [Varibaculum cambriense]
MNPPLPPAPPAGMNPPYQSGGYPQPMPPAGYPPYPPQGGAGIAQPLPPSASVPQGEMVGYPQAGYPPVNPAAMQPPYAANLPGYPQPQKSPNDFVLALKAIWPTFVAMHKSEGQQQVKANFQLKHWWWVMMVLFSLLTGLSSSVILARSGDIFSGGLLGSSGFGTYSILYFGYWLLCFVVFTLVAFAVVILRAALALAAARTKQSTITFTQVASIVATGLVMPSFALALMFLISLLPIPVLPLVLILVLQVLISASFLIMELLIFGGLKELYPQDKSPEMRHTIFFIIWTLCASLVIGMLAAPTGTYAVKESAKAAVEDTVQNQVDELENLKRMFDQ